jgi:hypothetical protein
MATTGVLVGRPDGWIVGLSLVVWCSFGFTYYNNKTRVRLFHFFFFEEEEEEVDLVVYEELFFLRELEEEEEEEEEEDEEPPLIPLPLDLVFLPPCSFFEEESFLATLLPDLRNTGAAPVLRRTTVVAFGCTLEANLIEAPPELTVTSGSIFFITLRRRANFARASS